MTFVAELEQRCQALETFPLGFPFVPGREASGIRRRPDGDYLIFYRIDDSAALVKVLHVLNGAQNYKTTFLLK